MKEFRILFFLLFEKGQLESTLLMNDVTEFYKLMNDGKSYDQEIIIQCLAHCK